VAVTGNTKVNARQILSTFGINREEDSELIFFFFVSFSRFEHELVESGCFKERKPAWVPGNGTWNRIEADWDAFIRKAEAMLRVRNNLFHGGKLRDSRDRTIELITSSTSILEDFRKLLARLP